MKRNTISKWWTLEGKELADALFRTVKAIDDHQTYRHEKFKGFLGHYESRPLAGLGGGNYHETDESVKGLNDNATKSLVDSLVAKIATKKVKPMFLTIKGDPSTRKRAKNLNKFVAGIFYHTDFYKKARLAFRDACIFGNGYLKVYDNGKEIVIERIFPHEDIVDDVEARYCSPNTRYQHKEYSKEVAKNKWPDYASEIEMAPLIRESEYLRNRPDDVVSVVEGWHLGSKEDRSDGRHVITVENATLLDEPYDKDFFPTPVLRINDPVLGFWGIGIVEEVERIQAEIDFLNGITQEQMNYSSFNLIVEKGAGINTQKFGNKNGKFLETNNINGIKPFTPNTVSQENWQQQANLKQRMFDNTGISMLSAQSKKPEGLDSGKALRTYYNIESERFMAVIQQYEEFTLECAKQVIELAKDISERGDGETYEILAMDRNSVERIKWSDVALGRDKYIMQVSPINFLPSTPAGKLQATQEMSQSGMYSPDETRTLLDFPDTEAINSRKNAPYRRIERSIEMMLEGKPQMPDPFTKLEIAATMVTEALSEGELDGYDDNIIQLLRDYIEGVKNMLQPPAPPQPMAPPGAPVGVPPPIAAGAPTIQGAPPQPGGMPPMPE